MRRTRLVRTRLGERARRPPSSRAPGQRGPHPLGLADAVGPQSAPTGAKMPRCCPRLLCRSPCPIPANPMRSIQPKQMAPRAAALAMALERLIRGGKTDPVCHNQVGVCVSGHADATRCRASTSRTLVGLAAPDLPNAERRTCALLNQNTPGEGGDWGWTLPGADGVANLAASPTGFDQKRDWGGMPGERGEPGCQSVPRDRPTGSKAGMVAGWQFGRFGIARSSPGLPVLPGEVVNATQNACKKVPKVDFSSTKHIDSFLEFKVSTRPLLISPSPIQAPLPFPDVRHPQMPPTSARFSCGMMGTGGSLSGQISSTARTPSLIRFQSRGFYVPVGRAISTALRARHAPLRSREEQNVAPSL